MRAHSEASKSARSAVLPLITVQVISVDELLLTDDGQRISELPVRREELGTTIAKLAQQHQAPVRVEVHERDGSVFADIIDPTATETGQLQLPTGASSPSQDEWVEVTGDGFVPGEDVALALIIRHTSASPDGHARALLGRNELPAIATEAILFGRISGTAILTSIP